MDIVIGPVLKHPGGYGFDVWTAAKVADERFIEDESDFALNPGNLRVQNRAAECRADRGLYAGTGL
jgi:hypothetical protein